MTIFISKWCNYIIDCENVRNVCKLIEKLDLASVLILDAAEQFPSSVLLRCRVLAGWPGLFIYWGLSLLFRAWLLPLWNHWHRQLVLNLRNYISNNNWQSELFWLFKDYGIVLVGTLIFQLIFPSVLWNKDFSKMKDDQIGF